MRTYLLETCRGFK